MTVISSKDIFQNKDQQPPNSKSPNVQNIIETIILKLDILNKDITYIKEHFGGWNESLTNSDSLLIDRVQDLNQAYDKILNIVSFLFGIIIYQTDLQEHNAIDLWSTFVSNEPDYNFLKDIYKKIDGINK